MCVFTGLLNIIHHTCTTRTRTCNRCLQWYWSPNANKPSLKIYQLTNFSSIRQVYRLVNHKQFLAKNVKRFQNNPTPKITCKITSQTNTSMANSLRYGTTRIKNLNLSPSPSTIGWVVTKDFRILIKFWFIGCDSYLSQEFMRDTVVCDEDNIKSFSISFPFKSDTW